MAGWRRVIGGHRGSTTATSEYGTSGKWLELLKEIAPGVTRAAVLRDPTIPSGIGQFASMRAVGTEALPPIEAAPGSYVRVRA